MNKLESLVPPLELCERIPVGKFEDSALVWIGNNLRGIQRAPAVVERHIWQSGDFPAPTLAEILEALPKFDRRENCLAVVPDFPDDGKTRVYGDFWLVGYTKKNNVKDNNPATAALRLWLDVEGVEKFVESDLLGTPETPEADFVERVIGVPPDCYAVTDGETWGVYPKKYCRGARIIRCSKCGAPATRIDPNYPRFDDWNLCDECNQDKELEDE